MRKNFISAVAFMAATLVFSPNLMAGNSPSGASTPSPAAETAQTGICSGTVVDEEGEPLVGASIFVEGGSAGASADLDGKFSIPGVKIGSTLKISYVGYKPITVVWNGQPLSIKMESSTSALDELVVVGFGVQKKSDLTGAVSQVKMDDILGDRPVTSTAAALQGAIPGLMISGNSNVQGSKTIQIRGDLSINGGSPLILIDNVEGNLQDVNPNDIETITVLKDASSAAIYGARAAGGVVLITTKRPKDNTKFSVTYSFNQGWEKSLNRPEQVGLLDYINAYQDAGYSQQYWAGNGSVETWKDLIGQYRAGQLSGVTDNGIYINPDDGRTYYLKESNVQGAILGTGALSDHNIAITGGTDKVRFRMSGNFTRNNGPVITDKDLFIRKSISSYISADVTSWYTQELNMFYTDRMVRGLVASGAIRDPYATRLISWYPVDGMMPGQLLSSGQDKIIDSPKNGYLYTPSYDTHYYVPRIQVRTTFKPLKNWTITGEYTYQQTDQKASWYTGVLEFADVQLAEKTYPTDPTKDQYGKRDYVTKYNALNIYSNYLLDFGKNHFTFMLGFNQESNRYSTLQAYAEGQSVTTVPSFGGATGEKYITESYSDWTIRGGFGRITYNFDERYLFSFQGRYDGSSKFPKSNRFGFFPSASFAWRISNEKFMEGTSTWLSELKPRVSYGSIGNQNISPYGFVSQMSISQSNTWLTEGGRVTLISVPGLVRGNYTWETVKTFNIGLDFSLFNNRLIGSWEWYTRRTTGMLADGSELPSTVGAAAPLQNVANMKTDGWELSLQWRDVIGDWAYHVSFNLTDYKSTITKYNNATKSLNNWYEGEQINNWWGYVSDGYYSIDDFDLDLAKVGTWKLKEGVTSVQGVNVMPGDMKFKDLDGDGIITAGASTLDDPGDRKIIGNSTPRFQYGGNLGVSWKGIDLEVMLQGVGKGDYWVGGHALFPFGAAGSDGVFQAVYYNQLDYWKPISTDPNDPNFYVAENPNSKLFRVYNQMQNSGYNARTSDKYMQSLAYLRVKNITLGYTFPQKWMDKICVKQLRVYGSVENLHTFTSLPKGYDPENVAAGYGWSYPFYRTWSIGASITF